MSFEEAAPYVAAAYAVILVAIMAWAALAARRTARLRRRLDELERAALAQHPSLAHAEARPDAAGGARAAGGNDSAAEPDAIREERQPGG